jgi:hypothetical protein
MAEHAPEDGPPLLPPSPQRPANQAPQLARRREDVRSLWPFVIATSAAFVACTLIVLASAVTNVQKRAAMIRLRSGDARGIDALADLVGRGKLLTTAMNVTFVVAAVLLGVWANVAARNHTALGFVDERPVKSRSLWWTANTWFNVAAMTLRGLDGTTLTQAGTDSALWRRPTQPVVRWWPRLFVTPFVLYVLARMVVTSRANRLPGADDRAISFYTGFALVTSLWALTLALAAAAGIVTMAKVAKGQQEELDRLPQSAS